MSTPPKPDGTNTKGTVQRATKDRPAQVDATFIFPSVDYPTEAQLTLLRTAYLALDGTPLGEAHAWLTGDEDMEQPDECDLDEVLNALSILPVYSRRDQLVKAAAILLREAETASTTEEG